MVSRPRLESILTPHVVIIISVCLVVVIGLVYLSGENFECGLEENRVFCGSTTKKLEPEEQTPKEKTMFGYFQTFDDKGKTLCMSEKFKLKVSGHSVEGRSEGKVHKNDGTLTSKKWKQKGFRHGNTWSLAYLTDSNSPTGTGVYYLMSSGGEYVGYWLGLDFPSDSKVQCPYVLTEYEKGENETCKDRWPEIFTDKRCTKLERKKS